MSIKTHDDWGLSQKGITDAQRHRDKIDDQLRKGIRDVIAEESIITRRTGKTVRIPVKGLKDFRFKHGVDDDAARGGVGQGKGKPGDVIARRKGNQPGNGNEPGSEKGEEYMETEVSIDYLIKIMFEDLGLPYIEEKTRAELLVPAGWKFETISKKGIQPRLHKKRTILETMKRTAAYVAEIMDSNLDCSQESAEKALVQAEGDLELAIDLVRLGQVDENIDPEQLYIEDDDMRFKQIEQDYELHSNAVIIAMMDISGSMSTGKKYLARSFLFWMNEFLKKAYDNVQIRFIVHTTDARQVDEDTFFKMGENGGTICSSAFKLANYMLETEFPLDQYNRYVVYCSDGDAFDTQETMQTTKVMFDKGVNMLTYLEIKPDDEPNWGGDGQLLKSYRKEFNMIAHSEDGRTFFKNEEKHFLAGEIKNKDDVYPALRSSLFEKQAKK